MHRMGGCPTCGGGMGFGHHMGGGMKKMFMMMPWKIIMHGEELGLSDEQIEAIRNRHIEAKKQMIQIACQMKMAKIDLFGAIMREEIDMPTAEAKAREIGKLKGDMITAMIQAMNDMRSTLRPEQMKRIKEMVMSWFKKGGMAGMGMEEEEESEEEQEE